MSEVITAMLGSGLGSFFAILLIALGLLFLIAIITIISTWKIFSKAGEPGWTSLIPIYNVYIMTKIAKVSMVYFGLILLSLVTSIGVSAGISKIVDDIAGVVSFLAYCVIVYNIAKQFGKGIGYTLGLIFLPFIFYPMLAFGGSVYQGSGVASTSAPQTPEPNTIGSLYHNTSQPTTSVGDLAANQQSTTAVPPSPQQ
jgi:hypothetical protein